MPNVTLEICPHSTEQTSGIWREGKAERGGSCSKVLDEYPGLVPAKHTHTHNHSRNHNLFRKDHKHNRPTKQSTQIPPRTSRWFSATPHTTCSLATLTSFSHTTRSLVIDARCFRRFLRETLPSCSPTPNQLSQAERESLPEKCPARC